MAAKMNVNCTVLRTCKFKDRCIIIRPIKVLDPNDAGGNFAPVLKIRLINNELQVRCFSYEEGRDKND